MYVVAERNKFFLSKREIINILIAWLGITFAFSWRGLNFSAMLNFLPIILIGTLTGFIVHELAHKFVAIHYGAYAEFVMWPTGLIFAIILAIITAGGFVFAAPGAVYIFGEHITRKQNGIISVAGPLANLIIAIIFLILALLFPQTYFAQISFGVFYINTFLGLFNMLPIPPLDGYKIFLWNKIVWLVVGGILLALFMLVGLW